MTAEERASHLLAVWEEARTELLRIRWSENSPLFNRLESLLLVQGLSWLLCALIVEGRFWAAGSSFSPTVAIDFMSSENGARLFFVLAVGQAVAGLWLFKRLERAHAWAPRFPLWWRWLLTLCAMLPVLGLAAVPVYRHCLNARPSFTKSLRLITTLESVGQQFSTRSGRRGRLSRWIESRWWTDLGLWLWGLLVWVLLLNRVAEQASPEFLLVLIFGLHALALGWMSAALKRWSLPFPGQRWWALLFLIGVAVPYAFLLFCGLIFHSVKDAPERRISMVDAMPNSASFPEARGQLALLRTAAARRERGFRRWWRFFQEETPPVEDLHGLDRWSYRAKTLGLGYEAFAIAYWLAGPIGAAVTDWRVLFSTLLIPALISGPIALITTLTGGADLWQRLFGSRVSWFRRWPWLPFVATTQWVFFLSGCLGVFTRQERWDAVGGVLVGALYLFCGYIVIRFVLAPVFSSCEPIEVFAGVGSVLLLLALASDGEKTGGLLKSLVPVVWLAPSLFGTLVALFRFHKLFPFDELRGRTLPWSLRFGLGLTKVSIALPLGGLAIPFWIRLHSRLQTEFASRSR